MTRTLIAILVVPIVVLAIVAIVSRYRFEYRRGTTRISLMPPADRPRSDRTRYGATAKPPRDLQRRDRKTRQRQR